jgi:hypothetical protein
MVQSVANDDVLTDFVFRNWIVHRYWSSTSARWPGITLNRIPYYWRCIILHSTSAWGDGCDFPCSRFFFGFWYVN